MIILILFLAGLIVGATIGVWATLVTEDHRWRSQG